MNKHHVSSEKKKRQQARRAAPPLPAVRLASLWALINAFTIAVALNRTLSAYNVVSKLPTWLYHRVELTDVAGARGVALEHGHIWCGVLQAAAAALALLLEGRLRRRLRRIVGRVLAYLALAATVAGHCMFASFVGIILAGDPGYLFFWIGGAAAILLTVAGDLFCFLDLLLEQEV